MCKIIFQPLVQALKEPEKKNALIVLLILLVGVGVMGLLLRTSFWLVLLGLVISVAVLLLIIPRVGNGILWTVVVLIPALYAGFIFTERKQKESKKEPAEKHYELLRYEKTTDTYELPDGRIFKMEKVEAELIRTPEESSYNPIRIHYHMPNSLVSVNDDNIIKCLQEYDRILDLYERDSVHFEVTREYLFSELQIQGYDPEKLKKMSEKQWFRLWEKSEDAQYVYDSYHNQYKSLIQVAYFNRGALLDRIGQPSKALEDYAHLDHSWYEPYILYKNRALAHFHLGENEMALSCLDEGIELIKYDDYKAPLFQTKGFILMEMDDVDGAISCFEKSIEQRNYNGKGSNYLGLAYYKKGDYNKAIEAFGEAIAICMGRIEEDESRGISAKWLYKTVAPYYYNRAQVYNKMGLDELAKEDERMVEKMTVEES